MKKFFPLYGLLFLSLLLISWGNTGHRKIGSAVILFLNEEMAQFDYWPALLSAHGSDADYRKGSDPTEGPKHYIDIDNYPEFVSSGRIPQTLDSVYMSHNWNFVDDNGYLPWATETTYDSLKACFVRRDWNKAVLFAADLGHYVGDAHMPLHITRNYDGQFTGNNGIHSRYESDMINEYSSEISFAGDTILIIENVNQYIFDYIYSNYTYVDSVIAADDYASLLAGNTWSSQYIDALWEKTRSYTILLFRNASLALTELIYTAWDEAGRPSMSTTGTEQYLWEHDKSGTDAHNSGICLEQNYPNPFSGSTRIRFHLEEKSNVELYVVDHAGRIVDILFAGSSQAGDTNLEWQPGNIAPGNYYLVLENKNGVVVRKMILLEF